MRCESYEVTMAFLGFRFNVVALAPFSAPSFAGIAQLVEQLICNSRLTNCARFRCVAQHCES
jgi:hypothetical protein